MIVVNVLRVLMGVEQIEENRCCEKVRKGGCMSSLDEMNEMNH